MIKCNKCVNQSNERATLERYFLEEQGWDEEVVKETTTEELEELYEKFNQ